MKTAMLTLVLVLALGVLWRTHQLEKSIDESWVEVNDALVNHNHAIARLELQAVLNRCSLATEGMSSVERDPCRLTCWSEYTYETFWTEHLDELICKELW